MKPWQRKLFKEKVHSRILGLIRSGCVKTEDEAYLIFKSLCKGAIREHISYYSQEEGYCNYYYILYDYPENFKRVFGDLELTEENIISLIQEELLALHNENETLAAKTF